MRLWPIALAMTLSAPAEAANCRGYGPAVVGAIKPHVEALRMAERETADRIAGLDTRPFDHLLDKARQALRVIADPDRLAEEDALRRCRNYIPPIRGTCAAAGQALVALIEQQAGRAAGPVSQGAYAQAMPVCERFVGLTPLQTALRIAE